MKVVQWICAVLLAGAVGPAFAFCQPGDVAVCYVNGVQGTRVCGANAMYGPCSVPQPDPPKTIRIKPKYKVLTVVYAPPGTQGGGSSSSVSYGSGSSAGSTTSATHGFKQSYSVSASTSVGLLGEGGSVGLSFGYDRDSHNTSEIEIKKSGSTTITSPAPAIDGIDHDRDQIWLWLNPEVEVTMDGNAIRWGLVSGTPMQIQYVYVGHLKNPALMPPGVFQALDSHGITAQDYAEILEADPYAYGAPALDTVRYKSLLTTFPYEPPYAAGDPVPTYSFAASYDTTATNSSETSNEYSTGFSVSGTANLVLFKSKLQADTKWTWTDSTTHAQATGTTETASVTIGGPSFGYTGPTDMAVYYDTVYKSFMFTPVTTAAVTIRGALTSASNGAVAGREVDLVDANGTVYRTYANARGEYRFRARVTSGMTLRSGSVARPVSASLVGGATDLLVQ